MLRRAAALMRERANHASDASWKPVTEQVPLCPHDEFTYIRHRVTAPGWDTGDARTNVAETDGPDDALHIASWHPIVAFAVADWLDDTAVWANRPESQLSTTVQRALTVARAYLGSTA